MFSTMTNLGIIMENLRGLSISLVASTLIMPILFSENAGIAMGMVVGAYYGYRIEKQTHELRTLGGRVLRGKSMDYLIKS